MDVSLNADAALRAYVPPESWNGNAQHRFVFRTEEGDEEALLARLAGIQSEMNGKPSQHCILLRPERAQGERVFVVDIENYYFEPRGDTIETWKNPSDGESFNWALFEKNFNSNNWRRGISRVCRMKSEGSHTLLQINVDGCGEILDFENDGVQRSIRRTGFIWRNDDFTSDDQQDIRFLRQSTINFRRQIRVRWNKHDSEMQIAARWRFLGEERNSIAFRCRNGTWDGLKAVASTVLCVRLGRLKQSPQGIKEWDFTEHSGAHIEDSPSPNDEFLSQWRTAIVKVFQPENIDSGGVMIDVSPLCIWKHIINSDWRFVRVESPSQHELVEANLKLREWTMAHFSPDEAERLLAL